MMSYLGVAIAGGLSLLGIFLLQHSDRKKQLRSQKGNCTACPAGSIDDPLQGVALIMTCISAQCKNTAADPIEIARILQPLESHGAPDIAAERAVAEQCCNLECALAHLAPKLTSAFRFAERGQIVAMADETINAAGGDASCREKILPMLRRKLALSAK